MIVAHKVNAAREPISVAKKATINFEIFEKTSIHSSIDYLFLNKKYIHIYFFVL